MDSFEKFNGTQLPSKDEDYKHTQNIWKTLKK